MSRRLDFTIQFHSGFRVATGSASVGVDASVDRDEPLRGTSIKGVMAAAGRLTLGLPEADTEAVFGSEAVPSPWFWSNARFGNDVRVEPRHRVAIDPDTHTALKDHLLLGEVQHASTASFYVEQIRGLAEGLSQRHQLILTACARAVHALGAQRRRGLGWVGITGGLDLQDAHYTELLTLTGRS